MIEQLEKINRTPWEFNDSIKKINNYLRPNENNPNDKVFNNNLLEIDVARSKALFLNLYFKNTVNGTAENPKDKIQNFFMKGKKENLENLDKNSYEY